MIVKNEEKNIERALGWAKDIAFEQIVVDTGSTDRTVELAKQLGAKVYHFEWINDFAAAKNYAMDQAEGDWIAILDADEYMTQENAEKLIEILENIQNDPELSEECDAITCPFIDHDDNGNVVSMSSHQRVFRNRPYLRFEGRIHEVIRIQKTHYRTSEINIVHTGYTQSSYKDTDKLERNIKMLSDELERDPDNPDIMLYLANAIISLGTDEARDEAEKMYLRALSSERPVNVFVKQLAYDFLIPRFSGNNEQNGSDNIEKRNAKKDEAIKLCDQAIDDLPSNIDYRYYRAVLNNQSGNYKAAFDDLSVCESALTATSSFPKTRLLTPSPLPLFYQLNVSAEGLGDEHGKVRNSGIIHAILSEAKYQTEIVGPYIRAMSWYGLTDDEVFGNLAAMYDLSDPKELMFIARAARDSGALEFFRNTMEMVKALMEGI